MRISIRATTTVDAARETVPLGEAVERWRQQQIGSDDRDIEIGGAGEKSLHASGDVSDARGRGAMPRSADAGQAAGERGGGTAAPRRGRRMSHHDEAYQVIQTYIADFARELNDRAPLKSSTMRAYNLYRQSSLSQRAFIEQLYAARAIVKERSGAIRSQGDQSSAGLPTKHKAAYYFAVLEDLLELRDDDEPTGRVTPIEQ